jgi:hypothetical protein
MSDGCSCALGYCNMTPKSKVVLAFFCCGLLAGLLGMRLLFSSQELGFGFWAMGILFVMGLSLGLVLAHSRRWITPKLSSSKIRYVGAVVVVPLAWPTAFVGVLAGMFACDRILRKLGPSVADRPEFPLLTLGLGMLLGALVSSAVVALALTIFTDRWDLRGFLLLAGSGLVTVLTTMSIYFWANHYQRAFFQASRDQIFFGSLLPIGMALFSAASGLWLLRGESISPDR